MHAMGYITVGLVVWGILLLFILAFNWGAHRKDDPDEFRRIRSLSWKDYPKEEM